MLFIRRSTILALGILVTYGINAQNSSFHPEKRKKQVVPLFKFETNHDVLPFKNIIVKDVRFDTSKIGYSDDAIAQRLVTKQPFETTLNELITGSLANKLDTNSHYNIHLFIRHFWIDCMPEKRVRQIFCKAQVEAFIESDSVFYPLFRFDSSFIVARQKTSLPGAILYPFRSCIERLSGLSPDSLVKTKRRLSQNDIVSNYGKSLAYAQIAQPLLNKGVYLTYNDFLSNKITYPEFRYEQTLFTDDLFIKQNSEEMILDNFWGFCDGEKQFIKLGHNFYQLLRQNHTFELQGPSSVDLLKKKEGPRVAGSAIGMGASMAGVILPEVLRFAIMAYDPSDKLVFKPMQLNLETGRPYGF